jgi:chemotaxis protein methyltransferase CheR
MQGQPAMDDHQFHQLLEHFGYSREGYRRVRKGVKKRLRQHMQALGCLRLSGYLETIERDPHRRSECLRCLSVPISRFMRDGAFWKILKAKALPDLADRFGGSLSVWSAGCACGEEVYSLVISARIDEGSTVADAVKLAILATDRNPVNLARARDGIYPASSFREMDAAQLARHFIPLHGGRRYRIRPELQPGICWLCCDISRLPVNISFQLILLRNNILTYLQPDAQIKALTRVLGHLQPGGLLVVGQRERLPTGVVGLQARYGLPFVYAAVSGRKGWRQAGG